MRLVFTTPIVCQYRVSFHEIVRHRLERCGVTYKLIYGQPNTEEEKKGDTVDIAWGTKITNWYAPGGLEKIAWQPYFGLLERGDFVVIDQESRLLSNYALFAMRRMRGLKVAYWGHGRDLQSRSPNGLRARWKRAWARQADWWFTYTNGTAADVTEFGFPKDRITVFNNAIDTTSLRRDSSNLTESGLSELRKRLAIDTGNVGLYVGGLYHDKRIDFLLRACEIVRQAIPDFVLIVAGAGAQREVVEELAASRSWLKYVGPVFGGEKAALLRLAKAFLIPGAVGLAVVDCFALGLPIITTAYPYHGPEFAYIINGENGIVVDNWKCVESYARAVTNCFDDCDLHAYLAAGALTSGRELTIENMSDRFVNGVLRAFTVFGENR